MSSNLSQLEYDNHITFLLSCIEKHVEKERILTLRCEQLEQKLKKQYSDYRNEQCTLTRKQEEKLLNRKRQLYIKKKPFIDQVDVLDLNEELIDLPLERCIMVTITLPPKRFPIDIDLKEYLLYRISKFGKYANYIYGTIEPHKNGRPHAHIIMNMKYGTINDLKKYLYTHFKDNRYNNKAIRIDFIKSVQKTVDYINKIKTPEKRGNTFFKLNS